MFQHCLAQYLIDAANAPSPVDPSPRVPYGADALCLAAVDSVMAPGLKFVLVDRLLMMGSVRTLAADDREIVANCFQSNLLQTS